MNLELITGPVNEPVTLAEAKAQTYVDHAASDADLARLIGLSREFVEGCCGRALAVQTFEQHFDSWGHELFRDRFRLARSPLRSISEIAYRLADETEAVLPPADYAVATGCVPGEVVLRSGKDWPTVELSPAAPIRIRFVAGYDDSKCPERLRHALLMALGHYYRNREAVLFAERANTDSKEVELGLAALAAQLKVWVS